MRIHLRIMVEANILTNTKRSLNFISSNHLDTLISTIRILVTNNTPRNSTGTFQHHHTQLSKMDTIKVIIKDQQFSPLTKETNMSTTNKIKTTLQAFSPTRTIMTKQNMLMSITKIIERNLIGVYVVGSWLWYWLQLVSVNFSIRSANSKFSKRHCKISLSSKVITQPSRQ